MSHSAFLARCLCISYAIFVIPLYHSFAYTIPSLGSTMRSLCSPILFLCFPTLFPYCPMLSLHVSCALPMVSPSCFVYILLIFPAYFHHNRSFCMGKRYWARGRISQNPPQGEGGSPLARGGLGDWGTGSPPGSPLEQGNSPPLSIVEPWSSWKIHPTTTILCIMILNYLPPCNYTTPEPLILYRKLPR